MEMVFFSLVFFYYYFCCALGNPKLCFNLRNVKNNINLIVIIIMLLPVFKVDKILKTIPKERHTYLFSATMTKKVAKLQRASLQNPVKVEVSTKLVLISFSLLFQVFLSLIFRCFFSLNFIY